MTPAFRAFLKRHDNTIATKMFRWVSRESTAGHSRACPLWSPSSNQGTLPYVLSSLPELLLYPSRRFEEYIHLLYALRLHTPAGHIDRGDLTTAIDQIKNYKDYIDQIKENIKMREQLAHVQTVIADCPTLSEANRYLIRIQDVVQLHCYDEKMDFPLRWAVVNWGYEHLQGSDFSLIAHPWHSVQAWPCVQSRELLHWIKATRMCLSVV